jgi:hypothetical protein
MSVFNLSDTPLAYRDDACVVWGNARSLARSPDMHRDTMCVSYGATWYYRHTVCVSYGETYVCCSYGETLARSLTDELLVEVASVRDAFVQLRERTPGVPSVSVFCRHTGPQCTHGWG